MTTYFTSPGAAHPALAALNRSGFPAARIEQVLALYDESHRAYHDREHIGEMLDAALALELPLSVAQVLAVLFHDAVCVPGAAPGSNEAMSAQLLRVHAAGVPAACVERACSIVLDTVAHVASQRESEVVIDLDLMRLGAERTDFERFSLAVFAEQRALIPFADDALAWACFAGRRVPFFERLLARDSIFHRPVMRARFEQIARSNLRAALGAATTSDSRETA